MSQWKQWVRRVEPYVPGEQPAGTDLIKLNTNENPYPPAPGVQRALKEMDGAAFRKYPDPAAFGLVKVLAERYGVDEDRIFVGVGSDDVLGMAFLTFLTQTSPFCSRTSAIPSTRCGRICFRSLTARPDWIRISGLSRRTI